MSLQTNFVKCSMTFHIERKKVKLFKMISRLAQTSFIKAEAILLPSDKHTPAKIFNPFFRFYTSRVHDFC